jgi:hypothetical protein
VATETTVCRQLSTPQYPLREVASAEYGYRHGSSNGSFAYCLWRLQSSAGEALEPGPVFTGRMVDDPYGGPARLSSRVIHTMPNFRELDSGTVLRRGGISDANDNVPYHSRMLASAEAFWGLSEVGTCRKPGRSVVVRAVASNPGLSETAFPPACPNFGSGVPRDRSNPIDISIFPQPRDPTPRAGLRYDSAMANIFEARISEGDVARVLQLIERSQIDVRYPKRGI